MCPCRSGVSYAECCRPFHNGSALPPTAVRLMRSRYAAFALRNKDYLLATWHPSTRPRSLDLDPAPRWTDLQIVSTSGGGLLENRGTVEFRATYRVGRHIGEQHENSRFVRSDGSWFYVGAI